MHDPVWDMERRTRVSISRRQHRSKRTHRQRGGQVSLFVLLTLYFLFLWISWILAVRVTEPRHTEPVGIQPA
jgi:hypothetical protein